MRTQDFERLYDGLATRFLGRGLVPKDGLPAADITRSERRLGISLPRALRAYYRVAGHLDDFNTIHNHLFPPERLSIADNHLLFMEENQAVVSWGVRLDELDRGDPVVWQRNNTPPVEWFSEEKTFSELLDSMLAWYSDMNVWAKR